MTKQYKVAIADPIKAGAVFWSTKLVGNFRKTLDRNPPGGKNYEANGERECARRVRQMAARRK